MGRCCAGFPAKRNADIKKFDRARGCSGAVPGLETADQSPRFGSQGPLKPLCRRPSRKRNICKLKWLRSGVYFVLDRLPAFVLFKALDF
jgi:hypothetical protein